MRLAGIDIGTNTLRLLIVESPNGEWREIFSDRRVTRLGEGFSQKRRLTSPAIQRTAGVLKSFYHSIRQFRCDEVLAVATSAVREAENQNEFLAIIKKEVPLNIRVISGDEEARLTWIGIRHAVTSSTDLQILIDIGGGSTEWILADHEKIVKKISLPLGVVFLTEQYLLSDPPPPAELERLKKKITESLASVKETFGSIAERTSCITWIGTAGTITTLAAMAQELEQYSFEKVNGFVLTQKKVFELYETLRSRTKNERRGMRGLEPGREDIILAGTIILLEAMAFFNFDQMVVSDYGLREGIIIDRLQQLSVKRKT
jgi:exopolyphosphatase/guanosine-5'-triphosphate,3'-diphosphate pyrophosphatase